MENVSSPVWGQGFPLHMFQLFIGTWQNIPKLSGFKQWFCGWRVRSSGPRGVGWNPSWPQSAGHLTGGPQFPLTSTFSRDMKSHPPAPLPAAPLPLNSLDSCKAWLPGSVKEIPRGKLQRWKHIYASAWIMVVNTPLTKVCLMNKPLESMWDSEKCESWEVWLVSILRIGEAGEAGDCNRKDWRMKPSRVIFLITTEHYGG